MTRHWAPRWAPLQRDISFGARDAAATAFAVGPGTVATAARLCVVWFP
jgi:hypothetical protein